MAYKIVITLFAQSEEDEAYSWYEKQRNGLGEELLKELEIAYQKISNNPQHYGFVDERKELRDYLIHRFPYLIVYRIKADIIEIIAVHHAKKHPLKSMVVSMNKVFPTCIVEMLSSNYISFL